MTDEERAARTAEQAQEQADRIQRNHAAKMGEEMRKAHAEATGQEPIELSEQEQKDLAAFTKHYTIGKKFYSLEDLATFLALAVVMNVVDKHGISFLKAGAEENKTYIDDEVQTALKIFENADFYEKLIEWEWTPKEELKKEVRRKISERFLKDWTYPVDTVHQHLFRAKPNEALALNVVGQADKQKGKNADIFVKYDFDKDSRITISKQLTVWDKRVYAALANLFIDGQPENTATHIYREAARNKKVNPTAKQISDLIQTIEKLRCTSVYIDTTEEHELYPQYPIIKGVLPLLDVGYFTEQVEVNGAIVDSTIKVFSLPRLFKYALEKEQVTTIDADLLRLQHLQTVESNISLHDYLMTRIVQMKRAANRAKIDNADTKKKKSGNQNTKAHTVRNTMLLSTIEENCGFASPKLKRSLPDKLNKILTDFKKQKFIKGYKWDDTKIKIEL